MKMKIKKLNKSQVGTVIFFAVLILFNLFVMNVSFVFGDSMENTIKSGSIVLVNKLARDFKYSDIVITDRKNPLEAVLIKRVIAAGGQRLEIKNNSVYVDGVELDEEYLPEPMEYDGSIDIVIPDGEVFLMGDNRNFSRDSREIGCIPIKNIKGKVILP